MRGQQGLSNSEYSGAISMASMRSHNALYALRVAPSVISMVFTASVSAVSVVSTTSIVLL